MSKQCFNIQDTYYQIVRKVTVLMQDKGCTEGRRKTKQYRKVNSGFDQIIFLFVTNFIKKMLKMT
jgi:hypothetical protein